MASKLFIITSVILAVLAFQRTLGRPANAGEERVVAELLQRQVEVSDPPSYGESSAVSDGSSDINEDNGDENEEEQEVNDDEGETGEDGEETNDDGDEEGTASTNDGVVLEEKQDGSNDSSTVQTGTDSYHFTQYGGVASRR